MQGQRGRQRVMLTGERGGQGEDEAIEAADVTSSQVSDI